MKAFACTVRLYWPLWLIADLGSAFIFYQASSLAMVLLFLAFAFPAIYLVSKPFVGKYDNFFRNLGHSPLRLAAAVAGVNAFLVLSLLGLFNDLGR